MPTPSQISLKRRPAAPKLRVNSFILVNMNIPNDSGHPYRLSKFIEYQHKAAPLDPTFLLAYAKSKKLNPNDAVLLALLHSAVYCEVTAIFLFEAVDWTSIRDEQVASYWIRHKSNLIFNSSRRYAKNMDWFPKIVKDILRRTQRNFIGWAQYFSSYETLRGEVEALKFTGRFAAGRFMEPVLWFAAAKLVPLKLKEPERLPWERASNETSGLLNVLYRDEEADNFDRTGALDLATKELLNVTYLKLHDKIFRTHPDQIPLRCAAQGKLCSWRNLFKGRRYGGYHHDRQLENLRRYEVAYPAQKELWARLYKLRRNLFAPEILGEISGWDGIRKGRQKLWLAEGRTGVERN